MHKQITVACCHNVFTKEQRLEYKNIWETLVVKRKGIKELEQGYEYQFPGDAETLRNIIEWVSMERRCCPFLTFTVVASNVDEPILLQLTGNEETKAFLKSDMESNISIVVGTSEKRYL